MKTPNLLNGLTLGLLLLLSGAVGAQTDYPFKNLGTVTAELNVRTAVREKVNNRLLSVNIGWDDGLFGLDGYDNNLAKGFMREFQPVSLRFPHGVWSNWYDWEEDKPLHRDNYQVGIRDDQIRNNASADWTFGFDGLKQLHDEQGFDVLWTFSLLYDDATDKAVRRVRDHERKGFNVANVELGNEHFWKDQRSTRLLTEEDYLKAAVEMSKALKREKPSIKLSVTPSWRRGEGTGRTGKIDHTEYNKTIYGDGKHFDAITMHRYVNAGKGGTPTTDDYKTLLTSPLTFASDAKFLLGLLPNGQKNKEVWLTEWGVSGGYRAASYLGMADAYLYLFDNQDTYKYANWFQIHGTNNFFRQTQGPNRTLSTAKTGFGSVFQILRGVFQDATLLESNMTTKALDGTSKAVEARAVERNGETQVFVVNKTDQAVKFTLRFNGGVYRQSLRHEAMAFNDLGQDIGDVPYDRNPLKLIREGSGTITLPPYSINVLSNITQSTAAAQQPYAGVIQLPGTIQAENYDEGGQGVAYSDTDANNRGARYREDGVDIQFGNNSGLIIGWTAPGEWLEYSVNVTQAGNYNFTFHHSGLGTGSVSATFQDVGRQLFTGVDLAPTGDWASYATRTKYQVFLPAGRHTLRLNVDRDGFNLDRIEVSRPFFSNLRSATATERTSEEMLRVYPNPSADGRFQLSKSVSWELHSVTGATLATGKGNRIDVSEMPAGVYLLRAEGESLRLVRE